MSKHSGSSRTGSAARTNRAKKPVGSLARRLGFESLEHRRLLSTLSLTGTPPATSVNFGQVYTYTVHTNAPGGDTITVTPGTLPTYMQFDATTQTFTWLPDSDQVGTTQSFSATVTDTTAGSSTTLGPVNVSVLAASGLSVRTAPTTTISVGSPLLIAFNSTDTGGTPNYQVKTYSASDPNGKLLTGVVEPLTNQVLTIDTNLGDMQFQLLNNLTPLTVTHFVNLVESNLYNNTTFYRVIEDFMDQGGVGSSYTGPAISTIPVELNANLRFTSSGLLSLANDGVDGNSSEFFITNPDDTSDGFLDFRYTIFGKLISGDNVRQAIAATPVTTNTTTGEDSQPVTTIQIDSMSVSTETDAGVFMLSAAARATGPYTVTVTDGLGGSQSFTVNLGTNPDDPPNPWVAPINGTDTITLPYNGSQTITPQAEAAVTGEPVQVNAQSFLAVNGYAGNYVDNSYPGTTPAALPNTNMTLTDNGNGSWTVAPASGYYGVQALEVTAVLPVSGTFKLQVGSVTTGSISFNSEDLAATASGMQNALDDAGLSATVTAVSPTPDPGPTDFSFNVTFASGSNDQPIQYVAVAPALPLVFTNPATTAAEVQNLTFDETAPGTSWDGGAGVDPVYRAYVPVYVDPPAPQIASISAGGQTVSGTTAANNTTAAAKLSFHITGLADNTASASGDTVSVYMDGGATAIASGAVTAGATSIDLSTDGTTKIPDGSHTFTVEQTITTIGLTLFSDWATAGTFELQVGSVTTNPISFDSDDLATTAANMQNALQTAGLSGATVSVVSPTTSTASYSFNVTFASASNDQQIQYLPNTNKPMDVQFSNSAATAAQSQELTFVSTLAASQATPNGYPIEPKSLTSLASGGTGLTIGLSVLAPPPSTAEVNVPYSYVVKTDAPSGDALIFNYTTAPYTVPSGMALAGGNTFNWTPTKTQASTPQEFYVEVSDSLGNTSTTIRQDISVVLGLAPTEIPVNSSAGGDVTVFFSGTQVEVYDNVAKAVLSKTAFKSTDTVEVDCPAGQANSVLVMLPTTAGAAIPKEVLVKGAAGSTNNQVIIFGTPGANTFTLAGGTVTANGLQTTMATVQKVTLAGRGGNDYYRLNSSSIASNWIVDTGGYNTMDFSQDSGGVAVNLGLDKGQTQRIAPWNDTLSIYGVINKLIGSAYADVLTGGPAATTEICGGAGNDTIVGGSGENILMGGGGNDTIVGGPGRNLLIAGAGNCSIYANGSENMVFGGSTNYDSNDQALQNLLNQGLLFMYSYSFRRAMASAANNPALLSGLPTFQDSGAHDTIFGSLDDSWFVLGKNDTVRG
jgi:cyclophilin family peptidyl-prolyl cis-trans isomerase